ncbi:S1C family serine protease [Desulfonema magnum]|uniref:Peptidase domain-containing protein n=1 Tax=Desulfonema magnum TaxID=45655 RepID=A0A975BMM9_9BACT|nr:trypsin-like peptidase domain-containing protein [Desulfonema magnum]QTA88321.1 Peptidase domain-containing protein [Desulfonema magnum]
MCKTIVRYVLIILALGVSLSDAHEIYLKDGRTIKTKNCWEENGLVRYERYGGILSIKEELVEKIIYEASAFIGSVTEEQAVLRKQRTDTLASDEIFRICKPAVVVIKCGRGQGAGFFVSSRGHILTNFHVIRPNAPISVYLSSGREYTGGVISSTEQPDVALLKISESDLPYLALEKSLLSENAVGKKVFAVGNPLGLKFSISGGIISQIRNIDTVKYVQTDTKINPGNSGGPLIDTHGNVVGMNTFKIRGGTGLNFAISSDYLYNWVQQYSENPSTVPRFSGSQKRELTRGGEDSREGGGIIIVPFPFPSR